MASCSPPANSTRPRRSGGARAGATSPRWPPTACDCFPVWLLAGVVSEFSPFNVWRLSESVTHPVRWRRYVYPLACLATALGLWAVRHVVPGGGPRRRGSRSLSPRSRRWRSLTSGSGRIFSVPRPSRTGRSSRRSSRPSPRTTAPASGRRAFRCTPRRPTSGPTRTSRCPGAAGRLDTCASIGWTARTCSTCSSADRRCPVSPVPRVRRSPPSWTARGPTTCRRRRSCSTARPTSICCS